MFDRLLPYYNTELRFMREMARSFAERHPKIAGRLRLSGDAVEDPHVSRLVESFAFLNARLRLKLDDDFPELSEGLLDQLYPHYLAPIPSMAIVQMTPQGGLAGEAVIEKHTEVVTETVDGESLRYRTGYPVSLWPIELVQASLTGLPLAAPPNRKAAQAMSVLRLTLRCATPDLTFEQLGLDRVRFHIHGEARTALILHELICGATLSVAVADNAVDEGPVILDANAILPVGCAEAELLLPHTAGADPGFVTLSEYFAFPEKMMFFDVVGLSAKTLMKAGREISLFFYFDRFDPSLEGVVTASDFRLFCTPVVNLFSTRCDPIRLDPSRFEHRIVPDARRESSLEIYSVDQVTITDRSGDIQPFRPFFSLGKRQIGRDLTRRFWRARREESPYLGGGDDVHLSLFDESGSPVGDRELVASIDATCTNRNLAERLPFGDGRPEMKITGQRAVKSCRCLSAPTRPLRSRRGPGALWRLVSHLNLNFLSMADDGASLDALKEMLALYESADTAASRAVIERLTDVRLEPGVARAPVPGRIAFTSGIDATLEFDDRRLSGSGAFLLGSVLASVLAGLSAINAFTRVKLTLKGEKGVWRQWSPKSGTRGLI